MNDIDSRQSDRSDDRAFPTADRAIATTGIDDAIGQFKFKNDRATMALEAMYWIDGDATDRLYHWCLART